MKECIYCHTAWVWFPCNVLRKLVADSGCKQIQSVDPCVLQSLGKMKHLFSILNWPWHFAIPSLHVHLEHWKGTLQTLHFFCWESNSKWTCWCARVFCCVYPPFSKDMKVQYCCLSASELLYLVVLLWILESQTLLLLIPEHLYVSSPPFLTISSQLTPRYKRLPNVILMHLFVSKLGSFFLSDLPLFNLKFSTDQRSSCVDRLLNIISAWYE